MMEEPGQVMEHKEYRATSDVLQDVVDKNNNDNITLGEIKQALHERGFGFLMLVFALPLCVPVPLPPGFTFIPSLPLLAFALQLLSGMDSPWLPKWAGNIKIKRATLAAVALKSSPLLKKIERILRPRFSFASSKTGEKIVGLFATIFSISIAVPLPLTNFIPATGIALMSLGLLSRDGIVVILGMLVGCAGVTLTTLIVLLGKEAVIKLFEIACSPPCNIL